MAVEDSIRDLLVSTIGEFIGTFMFLFIAFISAATVNQPNANGEVPSSPDPARVLFIALGFGFSLAVNAWVFFRVSGSAFNPAVTFALCILGAVPFVTSICAVGAQLLGGMAAAIVVKLIVPGNTVHFAVSLAPGVTDIQGFFIEMFLTFELVITILMLAGEKTKVTFIAPVGIGLSLFIDHLAGAFWTGAGMNPARSFGAAVAAVTFPGYHWIYWFGPLAGALLAAALYKLLKILHYENVNGHQDKSADEEAFKPLLADQTSKIERFFQRSTPRAWGSSRTDADTWPLSPQSRGRQPQPQPLRLYRLSGLDQYMSERGLPQKSVVRQYEYSPSRYAGSQHQRSPREW